MSRFAIGGSLQNPRERLHRLKPPVWGKPKAQKSVRSANKKRGAQKPKDSSFYINFDQVEKNRPFPFERFKSPEDEYSLPNTPEPSHHKSVGTPDIEGSEPPRSKPKLQFTFPPLGRLVREGGEEREPVSDEWLHEMLVDVERGRREIEDDLDEAEQEVKDAVDELSKVYSMLYKELNEVDDFLEYMTKVVGHQLVKRIMKEADNAMDDGKLRDEMPYEVSDNEEMPEHAREESDKRTPAQPERARSRSPKPALITAKKPANMVEPEVVANPVNDAHPPAPAPSAAPPSPPPPETTTPVVVNDSTNSVLPPAVTSLPAPPRKEAPSKPRPLKRPLMRESNIFSLSELEDWSQKRARFTFETDNFPISDPPQASGSGSNDPGPSAPPPLMFVPTKPTGPPVVIVDGEGQSNSDAPPRVMGFNELFHKICQGMDQKRVERKSRIQPVVPIPRPHQIAPADTTRKFIGPLLYEQMEMDQAVANAWNREHYELETGFYKVFDYEHTPEFLRRLRKEQIELGQSPAGYPYQIVFGLIMGRKIPSVTFLDDVAPNTSNN